MVTNTIEPELVDSREIARLFGVSIGTVRGWVRAGRVPYLRPSRRVVRFIVKDVRTALTHNPSTQEGIRSDAKTTQ